ncbi:biosynthetic arginine decarboxylase [Prochlorococcus sp. MIT 1300]|uniref:biosynthetic arginine decarboxylase n=1 Tax=Prochlorococcus sp. MIT 1300 TaxID=3096218 RepID=UPI002A75FDB2|nr:biosynthetic arginine decarboxylase [Prochlorococcus sp. MIT 1300]
MPLANTAKNKKWTVLDSAALYGLDKWGEQYFSINELGHISVQPKGAGAGSLDLIDLVKGLETRNLQLPLLIRFDDILENRLEQIHTAFDEAIKEYKYAGSYQGVFPIKCNQQRHVVEELISSGEKWHLGLEAGSKAELLIALSLLNDPKALLICNGYKDQRYIETAILARQLGRQPVVVIEQADEVERIISSSRELGAAPLIGIRAKLASRSSGKWSNSVGETAKFGLSIPDILASLEALQSAGLINDLRLLHFHLGSQINDIAVLKDALQEASQIYVELTKLGAPMGYLDVGGGLGVDYDGSKTATTASTNYSLQNYANDVVATIKECCESNQVNVPTLISESGRAIASHFSVLLFNVLGTEGRHKKAPSSSPKECLSISNLRETLAKITATSRESEIAIPNLQEAWNDAIKFKNDALAAFRLGYLRMHERALAEQLTWACAREIVQKLPIEKNIPDELKNLRSNFAHTYYANLSIFRSAPDTWAIDQVFPIMPIHRLNEEPTELGHFADLTCDSHGKITRFIDNGEVKSLLELHQLKPNETYIIGMFLGGAYQEVMGNLHNLFGTTNAVHIRLATNGNYQVDHVVRGDTNANVLEAMEHDPEQLLEKLRIASESAIHRKSLKIKDAQRLMDHLETSLRQSTYLQQ